MINERKEAQRLLKSLGITPNILGYAYLIEAIVLVNESYPKQLKLVNEICASIAETFEVEPENVERCIRKAIETACKRMPHTYLAEMLGVPVNVTKGKYTNAEFIALCAEYIRNLSEAPI